MRAHNTRATPNKSTNVSVKIDRETNRKSKCVSVSERGRVLERRSVLDNESAQCSGCVDEV